MKSTKKLLALLLALVLVLAACGPTTTPEEPTKPTEGETPTEPTEPTEPTGEEPTGEETPEDPAVAGVQKFADAETLVVGAPELSGDYINGFGNSSYDVWIKNLIGTYGGELGYGTIYSNANGEFVNNPTVQAQDPEVTTNADGSKTYRFFLKDGLVWNDGTPITAKDYVFGTFFTSSPEWGTTGSQNNNSGEDLVGFVDYNEGKTRTFPGLNLVDEKTFEITLDASKVPYFFETALVATSPTPMHRYAPNLDIVGSELVVKEGYTVTDADKALLVTGQEDVVEAAKTTHDAEVKAVTDAANATPEEETEETKAAKEAAQKVLDDFNALVEAGTLQETLDAANAEGGTPLDPKLDTLVKTKLALTAEETKLAGYKDGTIELEPINLLMTAAANDIAYTYRFKPDVTAGPYNFVSLENGMAKVTLNDKFVGNASGKKPTIKNVIVQTVQSTIDVDLVMAGTVDLAPGVIEGAKINKAKQTPDKVGMATYYRNGYGVMPILNHMGATQHKGVRQAIAYSLDRTGFVQTIAEGYGTVVNGAFGVDQWEYVDATEEGKLDDLINYTVNVTAANAALDTTPYKFEKDGTTPWDAEKAATEFASNSDGFSYWRYDAEGNQLRVIHEGTVDNTVTDLINTQLPNNAKAVGMQYIINAVDFATLLNHYYYPKTDDKEAPTVFNMGNGFGTPNDPYYSWHSSQIGAGNLSNVNDPELDKVLDTMRKADATDRETWLNGWVTFQHWYNENMPAVPLYGNEYHDIHTSRVQGLETTPFYDWSYVITNLTLAQ